MVRIFLLIPNLILSNDYFSFKQFTICQDRCAMKVGTDGTLLGVWARGGVRILDVGTGTGLIALMMAQRFPQAMVDAIDIDSNACQQACENVVSSPFADRIAVHHCRLQDFMPDTHETKSDDTGSSLFTLHYDAVVANPPYFEQSLKAPDAQRSMARHTDSLSYRDLMNGVARLLDYDGEFSVVIPFDCRSSLETEAIMAGLYPSRVCAVKTTPRKSARRYLLAFRKHPLEIETSELLMNSDAYRDLVKDFYLKG